jgi:hypothetical protein
MQRIRMCAVAVLVAAAAVACDTADPTLTSTTPSTPTNPTVENFTGTLSVGSTASHTFNVLLNGGTLSITLTAPPNVTIGLGVGSPTGGVCTPFQNDSLATTAGSAPQISGQANAGTYCVEIFDVGGSVGLTGPVNYAVSVAHY